MSPVALPWPAGVLAELAEHPRAGLSVVIDADRLLAVSGDLGEIVVADDWSELRAAYESRGRRRPPAAGRLVIVTHDPSLRTARDLPWDIERASRVIVARFPGSREWLGLWRSLGATARGRLSTLLERRRDPQPAEILESVCGVVLPAVDPVAEFDAVVRLRLSGDASPEVWQLVRGLTRGHFALSLAADPPDLVPVQEAWDAWLAGGADDHLLSSSGPALVSLLTFGLLRPAPKPASGLPAWTAVGTVEAKPGDRLVQLLADQPAAGSNLEEWTSVAVWWGAVRAALAEAGPQLASLSETAWAAWAGLDADFRPWITANLGLLQTSSRTAPASVHRIAPFLARRRRDTWAKICLVVLDGMGFTQWTTIRERLGLRVEEAYAVAAVAPTLTPYSRQAIFAGALPRAFPESINNNSKERDRWAAFWTTEEVDAARIRYAGTSGASIRAVPTLGGADVMGIAVLAVDDQLHGARLLGDAEVNASLGVWLDHGFLRTLIELASTDGFEVWLTADHGNLEAIPTEYLPQEGLAVDRTGERVRLYATGGLRDAARAIGFAWDPPGLPAGGPAMFFAPGRTAFVHGTDPVVVHGGLSFDEVLVPLVRVTL